MSGGILCSAPLGKCLTPAHTRAGVHECRCRHSGGLTGCRRCPAPRGWHQCGDPPAMPNPITASPAQTPCKDPRGKHLAAPGSPRPPSTPTPWGSHPGPRLRLSQPAPTAPAAAPWRCPCRAGRAALLRSPCPTAEETNRPTRPRSGDRLSRGAGPSQPHIPAPALPALEIPRARGRLRLLGHPLVPNTPEEPPHWTAEPRHRSGL